MGIPLMVRDSLFLYGNINIKIYKSIKINCYPPSLDTEFNATITDILQTNVTKPLYNSSIILFDYKRQSNNNYITNKVSLKLDRISGKSSTLGGYEYWTNNTSATPSGYKQLNGVTSQTISIANLCDPGAKINLYGKGNGTIKTEGGYASEGNAWISASYQVSVSNFSYPSSFTVTVTPTRKSSADVEWQHYVWNVRTNCETSIISNLSGNVDTNGKGTFKVTIPYNAKWNSDPIITVYCSHIEAYASISGEEVYGGFRTNNVSGYITGFPDDEGKPNIYAPAEEQLLVAPNTEFPDARIYNGGSGTYYLCNSISGIPAWVYSGNGSEYKIKDPGSIVQLEYYG